MALGLAMKVALLALLSPSPGISGSSIEELTRTSSRPNYDSISLLLTGEPYPSLWWEERRSCLAKLSPTLESSLNAAWAGMTQYWQTRGGENDTWYECDTSNLPIIDPLRSPDAYFENNCTRQEPVTMDIWEPCNYASNLAYDRLMLEMCLQEDWAFSSQTVGNISQAFALITFGSAFMHGSNTELGQKQDAVSNDLFPFIIYQAGVSNIAYDPVIHDLDLEPRPLSAEGIVAELFHMYESQPVSSWLSICNTISMPSLQRTFTGIFGYILTLLLDPDIVDQLVPVFLDLLAVSEEDREFTTLHFLPAIREASSEHYLGLRDRLVLWRDTLATVVKLFYAFIWQEKVIDFGGSNLTPEANQLGAQLLPIINQYANNQTSWSLHVEDVQAGEGYPGWQSCNPTIPHAKWHVQIAASLTDVSRLMDSVLRMVTATATTTTTQTTTTITTKTTLETTTTAPTTETTTTETCDPKLPTGSNCPASHDRGPLPDPDDCTAFWMCHDGCAVKTQCPVGTLYDMAEKACVPNNLIDCKASHRPCASEMHCSCVDRLPHPQQDERCSEDSSFDENFLVDENDCLSFFNCTLGCFDHYSCGTHNSVGLLWNQEHDWCDFPENVHCGTRPCNDPERCHGDNKPDPLS